MKRSSRNRHIGSAFEQYLSEQGDLEEATALAVKRVLAWELSQAMKKANISRTELARRMRTSRAVIHRLLDESDPSVTLATISRAATALGRSVRVRLAAREAGPSRRLV
jgi:DNA-binding Xre family transcriptional regulator